MVAHQDRAARAGARLQQPAPRALAFTPDRFTAKVWCRDLGEYVLLDVRARGARGGDANTSGSTTLDAGSSDGGGLGRCGASWSGHSNSKRSRALRKYVVTAVDAPPSLRAIRDASAREALCLLGKHATSNFSTAALVMLPGGKWVKLADALRPGAGVAADGSARRHHPPCSDNSDNEPPAPGPPLAPEVDPAPMPELVRGCAALAPAEEAGVQPMPWPPRLQCQGAGVRQSPSSSIDGAGHVAMHGSPGSPTNVQPLANEDAHGLQAPWQAQQTQQVPLEQQRLLLQLQQPLQTPQPANAISSSAGCYSALHPVQLSPPAGVLESFRPMHQSAGGQRVELLDSADSSGLLLAAPLSEVDGRPPQRAPARPPLPQQPPAGAAGWPAAGGQCPVPPPASDAESCLCLGDSHPLQQLLDSCTLEDFRLEDLELMF